MRLRLVFRLKETEPRTWRTGHHGPSNEARRDRASAASKPRAHRRRWRRCGARSLLSISMRPDDCRSRGYCVGLSYSFHFVRDSPPLGPRGVPPARYASYAFVFSKANGGGRMRACHAQHVFGAFSSTSSVIGGSGGRKIWRVHKTRAADVKPCARAGHFPLLSCRRREWCEALSWLTSGSQETGRVSQR